MEEMRITDLTILITTKMILHMYQTLRYLMKTKSCKMAWNNKKWLTKFNKIEETIIVNDLEKDSLQRVIPLKQKIDEEKKLYHKIEMALQNQFTRIKLLVRNNIFDRDSNRTGHENEIAFSYKVNILKNIIMSIKTAY